MEKLLGKEENKFDGFEKKPKKAKKEKKEKREKESQELAKKSIKISGGGMVISINEGDDCSFYSPKIKETLRENNVI